MFKNYWWESGNPYFLITLLKQKPYNIAKLENLTIGDELLNSFEIENLRLEVLLFQSGYLTIDKFIQTPLGVRYKLKVPNLEVQISLNTLFLTFFTNMSYNEERLYLYEALLEANIAKVKDIFTSLFASIPYNNYVKNNIADYEGYYASVFYAYLAASGLNIIAEDVTSSSRIDLTILMQNRVYIIEFKVDSNNALAQIKENNYVQKYLNQNKEIYLIGISFNSKTKNISSFEWERV
jgi:hypothetical protein